MKKTKRILTLVLTLVLLILSVSCAASPVTETQEAVTGTSMSAEEKVDLWKDATYREDVSLGSGKKKVTVEVIAGHRNATFTIFTDKETLGEALLEHDLVEGEVSEFGLYVKKVNGILADYDVDQSYWSLTKGGEMMMTGVSGEKIFGDEQYELTYTK